MTNILVLTHGNLAKEFVSIAETITQTSDLAVPVCFSLEMDQTEFNARINDAMASFDNDRPIIILTDLFGGTPSNLAIPFIQEHRVEVVTGLNLSMLLYLINHSAKKSFDELCKGVKQAGKEAIILAGEFLH